LRAADDGLPRDELFAGLPLAYFLAQSGLACAGGGLPFAGLETLFETRGSLRNLSVLDRVKDRAEALTRQISSSDSLRLDEYLGSVREMEVGVEAMRKSLEKAQGAAKGQNRPVFSMERPANGMPEDFRDRTCQGA
jgi:Protein of unknown function (DUF1552)